MLYGPIQVMKSCFSYFFIGPLVSRKSDQALSLTIVSSPKIMVLYGPFYTSMDPVCNSLVSPSLHVTTATQLLPNCYSQMLICTSVLIFHYVIYLKINNINLKMEQSFTFMYLFVWHIKIPTNHRISSTHTVAVRCYIVTFIKSWIRKPYCRQMLQVCSNSRNNAKRNSHRVTEW